MEDDLIGNKEFEIPIIESRVNPKKSKKEYKQFMVKLPKKLIKILHLNSKSTLRFIVNPLKENEKYPNFKLELIRNENKE